MQKRTKTYTITAAIWLTVLLGTLAFVFVSTGCSPVYGPKGDQGVSGGQGPSGANGLTIVGPQGPAGVAGVNGTNASIGIVPLCPGVSSYGTFVEVGLCINNDLYAVYSTHGGFMTYLAPGNYSSNAVGSACNLTVSANCVVSHR